MIPKRVGAKCGNTSKIDIVYFEMFHVETILTILDEGIKKHGREQYIPICPDLYHLMELESHTTLREETTPTISHMWSHDSSMG